MPGLSGVKAAVDAFAAGQTVYCVYRKLPAVVTAAGYWQDLAMSPGYPRPNYYASTPLTAATIARSTDGGIDHGGPVSPASKHLACLLAMTQTAGAVPLPMILCDYLLYYPFIDEGVADPQAMIQTQALSRYTDGKGVQMMAVCVAPHVGGGTFTVTYTNQDGNTSTTPTMTICSQAVNGTIVTTAPNTQGCWGPFLPLAVGDTGVRAVQSVQMIAGDVGLFTLVLVKPLANLSIVGVDAPAECCYLMNRPSMPRVYDDAYLNILAYAAGNITGASISGEAQFVWS
jgi:hypothetical protein